MTMRTDRNVIKKALSFSTEEELISDEDYYWWMSTLGPLGYTVTQWTYRLSAQGFHEDKTWHMFEGHLVSQLKRKEH